MERGADGFNTAFFFFCHALKGGQIGVKNRSKIRRLQATKNLA
jgi:hypothetical protein